LREVEKGVKSEQFEFLDDVEGNFGEKGNCYIRFWLKEGPYANQILILQIRFIYGHGTIYQYPKNPPSISFMIPAWHANIYGGGAICLDVLRDDKWSPMQDIDSVFSSLLLLLTEPNPSSPANSAAGQDFKKLSPAEFAQKALDQYLKKLRETITDPDSERKNALALVQTDAFVSGMKPADLELRNKYRSNILAALGLSMQNK
jgi:ubiquitin-protein ligase